MRLLRAKPNDEESASIALANGAIEKIPKRDAGDVEDSRPFKIDAKIWHVYLEDAEKVAREQAELWRTGLESLLIFAGLFAAVVSSFLIDSKKDLQSNSEQRLLQDIRKGLLQNSEAFHYPTYTDTVNGLWIVSLYLTLFSAIIGVLAKAWTTKYIPATSRHEASDALNRFILDQQARSWYIQEVITVVPLLVQVATFLFMIGLFLQIFDDSKKLGYTLLGFCVSGGVVYLVITGTHLFTQTAPVNTPLSELLLTNTHRKAADDGFFPIPQSDKDPVLAHILYAKLIMSPKHSSLDAAIEAVAKRSFHEKWALQLCQNSTPEIIATRLQRCVTTGSQDKERRRANISNQLMALLWFSELYDTEANVGDPRYKGLDNTLRSLLEQGRPLNRLNGVDSDHRPLLFALCATTLVILPTPVRPHLGIRDLDLETHELIDRPWEMVLQKIESDHRVPFMLAACRGTARGKKVLRMTSASILSLSFAKAASHIMETGVGAEWDALISKGKRGGVERLAIQYVEAVYSASIESFRAMPCLMLKNTFSAWGIPQSSALHIPAELQIKAVSLLALPFISDASKTHIDNVFADVSSMDSSTPVSLNQIQGLIRYVVFAVTANTRYRWLEVLRAFVKVPSAEFPTTDSEKNPVIAAFAQSLQHGLESDSRQAATLELVKELYKHRAICPLYPSVKLTIAEIVKVDEATATLIAQSFSEAEREEARSKALEIFTDLKNGDAGLWGPLDTLTGLIQGSGSGEQLKHFAFAWDTQTQLIIEFSNLILAEVVANAVLHRDNSTSQQWQTLSLFLRSLRRAGQLQGKLDPSALDAMLSTLKNPGDLEFALELIGKYVVGCLDFMANPPTLHNMPILEHLVKMAFNKDARPSVRDICGQAATNVCAQNMDLHPLHLQCIGEAVLQYAKDLPFDHELGGCLSLICAVAKRINLPETIPMIAEAVSWEYYTIDAIAYFFMTINSSCSTYYEPFAKTVPRNLSMLLSQEVTAVELRRNARWIRLLAVLSGSTTPELRGVALNGLRNIVQEIATSHSQSVGTTVQATETGIAIQSGGGSKSQAKDKNKRSALPEYWRNLGPENQAYWVRTYSILATYVKDLQILVEDILQCWKGEKNSELRNICFDELSIVLLGNGGVIGQEAILQELCMILGSEMDSKSALDQILSGSVDKCTVVRLIGKWMTLSCYGAAWETSVPCKLIRLFSRDRDPDVRFTAIETLIDLVRIGVIAGPTSNDFLKTLAVPMLKDPEVRIRQFCVEYLASRLKHAGDRSTVLEDFYKVVIWDEDAYLRDRALDAIHHQTMISAAEHEEHAGRLARVLIGALADPAYHWRAADILTKLAMPYRLDKGDTFHALQELLGKIVGDAWNFEVDKSIQKNGVHFESCQLALAHCFATSLGKQGSSHARVMAIALFGSLVDSQEYRSLLGNDSDEGHQTDKIRIYRLAEICINDRDAELRRKALDSLKQGCETPYWGELIKKTLSQLIGDALSGSVSADAHANAVSAIHDLVDGPDPDRFKDIISPATFQLMTVVVTEEDHPLIEVIKEIFLRKIAPSSSCAEIKREVWRAIVSNIAQATGESNIVENLASALPISDSMAVAIVNGLAPKLSNTPFCARAVIIKVLSVLHSRHAGTRPELLRSATSGLIGVALDEKETPSTRKVAAELLSKLSSTPSTFLHLAASATLFMPLLDHSDLRSCGVEILSAICENVEVRQLLLRTVISLSIQPGTQLTAGLVEFTTRIISDARLKNEPLDHVFLLLAPVLATRVEFSRHQFELLRSLQHRYPTLPRMEPENKAKRIVTEWFTYALFGRHARKHEVDTWFSGSRQWL
ncbi:hypothetical protein D9611_004420 [Ephemerocybe angulata]|uniref:DUF6535 domain-containing protein n=1 Tax=Ephemerocybe angulata TaxID=980116 RepID=A0A8H5F624_9AGAR|nr:hypothetical protein D9611_004420 [Tulosesus angulatus]